MSQNQVHENHEMSRALYEDLAALKIRIAFAEISEAELDEYDRELSSVSESDYSEAAQKRALKLIERKLNKRLSKRFIRKTLPHSLQIVTVTLLLFFIGLTTAVATVRPVRLRLMDFIAQIEENYSVVGLEYSDNGKMVVPEEWKGRYFPSYIPEEYMFFRVDDLFNTVYYATEDGQVLEFSESTDDVYRSTSISSRSCIDIEINGTAGIASVIDNKVTIVWSVEDVFFTLYFYGELDEAARIAESVQPLYF